MPSSRTCSTSTCAASARRPPIKATSLPAGIELGAGVKTVGTPRLMTQGSLVQTGKDYDVAIRGEGFFQITLPDGRTAYSRDGSFELDSQGRIVTAQGNVVQPGPHAFRRTPRR